MFVGYTSVSVDPVGDPLEPAVGQLDVVGARGLVSVALLLLAEVVARVVVLDLPVEGVLRGGRGVRRLRAVAGARGGLVGQRGGDEGGGGRGEPLNYVLPAAILGDRMIIIDFSPKGGPR